MRICNIFSFFRHINRRLQFKVAIELSLLSCLVWGGQTRSTKCMLSEWSVYIGPVIICLFSLERLALSLGGIHEAMVWKIKGMSLMEKYRMCRGRKKWLWRCHTISFVLFFRCFIFKLNMDVAAAFRLHQKERRQKRAERYATWFAYSHLPFFALFRSSSTLCVVRNVSAVVYYDRKLISFNIAFKTSSHFDCTVDVTRQRHVNLFKPRAVCFFFLPTAPKNRNIWIES